uniref:Secreted protein n=1 Tax=Otus sunia TaxID=257818 RepID=A0A8C8A6Q3_9STRI
MEKNFCSKLHLVLLTVASKTTAVPPAYKKATDSLTSGHLSLQDSEVSHLEPRDKRHVQAASRETSVVKH